jgi:hypothetical protein
MSISKFKLFERKKIDKIEILNDNNFDYFISSYTHEERIQIVYETIEANIKIWILFPEYNIKKFEDCFQPDTYEPYDESSFMINFFEKYPDILKSNSICIDITGFIIPYLVFMIKYLQVNNVHNFTLIYSEPEDYKLKEDTKFIDGDVLEIRGIHGFDGGMIANSKEELLLISLGFESKLLSEVMNKKSATGYRYFIYGFPSLAPEMYQQSVLKNSRVISEISNQKTSFGSSYDIFQFAEKLDDIYSREKNNYNFITLCPLGTKAQAVGMVTFLLCSNLEENSCLLYPFANSYDPCPSSGFSKLHLFNLELPNE